MKISVIGAGAIGGSMAEGFVRYGLCAAQDVTVTAPHDATLERYRQLGMNAMTSNVEAVSGADIVFVAVKPWLVEQVVAEIKPVLDYGRQTVLSVAAGVSGDSLKAFLAREDGGLPQIFIAIPNVAIAVGCSMTYILPVNVPDAGAVERMKDMFAAVGDTLVVEERQLDAVVKASCGIAYAMRYVRASMEGCVELGFKAAAARRLVLQTMKGAVALLQANGNHPEAEIDNVTTPGGFTIRGLNAMEDAGFSSAVIRGLKG